MTASEVRAPIASLFKRDFSNSCAAVDNVSTDVQRRAVPLRQLTVDFKFNEI